MHAAALKHVLSAWTRSVQLRWWAVVTACALRVQGVLWARCWVCGRHCARFAGQPSEAPACCMVSELIYQPSRYPCSVETVCCTCMHGSVACIDARLAHSRGGSSTGWHPRGPKYPSKTIKMTHRYSIYIPIVTKVPSCSPAVLLFSSCFALNTLTSRCPI